MKKIAVIVSICLLFSVLGVSQTTTVILLRHAEKDTSAPGSAMMKADPPLSVLGEKRAASLPEVLKAYHPDSIYSTNYTRTKATINPLAQKFGLPVQLYDPAKLNEMADKLLAMKGGTIIVVGHSNTTPRLVNLLIEQNKYPDLNDSVYNQLWIVTIRNGKAEEKIITY